MKRLSALIVVFTAVLAAPSLFAATKWQMPTAYGDSTFHTQNIRQFAKDVAEATGGELEIVVHSAGSLVKHPQIKRAVQTGQAQIGESIISLHANEDPLFGLDSLPFVATSYEEAEKLWAAQRPAIEKKLAGSGLKLLYTVAWPPQGLYTAKPVNHLADMRGVRFRAYNNATSRVAELMGATPTQIETTEIPQAFSTGMVAAMMTSPSTGVTSSAWDYVDHYYDVKAWLPKNMVYVNQRAFDALSKEQQQAVLAAARQAELRGWEMSRREADEMTRKLAEQMEVHQPTEQLMSEFAQIGQTMLDEWLNSAGDEGRQVVEAYRAASR